jgi:hypothetical protein
VETAFWTSPNFWRPPPRSWPWPPTKLERIAEAAGLDDEHVRAILYAEIERRSAELTKREPSHA